MLDEETGHVISTHFQLGFNQNLQSSHANFIAFGIEIVNWNVSKDSLCTYFERKTSLGFPLQLKINNWQANHNKRVSFWIIDELSGHNLPVEVVGLLEKISRNIGGSQALIWHFFSQAHGAAWFLHFLATFSAADIWIKRFCLTSVFNSSIHFGSTAKRRCNLGSKLAWGLVQSDGISEAFGDLRGKLLTL